MRAITKLNKELKKVESELSHLEGLIKNGWDFYLGDPIFKVRREVLSEVERLKKAIHKLS